SGSGCRRGWPPRLCADGASGPAPAVGGPTVSMTRCAAAWEIPNNGPTWHIVRFVRRYTATNSTRCSNGSAQGRRDHRPGGSRPPGGAFCPQTPQRRLALPQPALRYSWPKPNRPAGRGGRQGPRQALEHAHVLGLRTLLALGDVELHPLVLLQAAVAVGLD